jgi:cob(I)alamin adenosyltransferase
MSIVTKGGDKGETSLLGGQRVPKMDPRIEAYGQVDELNSAIGLALNYVKNKKSKKVLIQVMNDLFRIGAELAAVGTSYRDAPKITSEHTARIEKEIFIIEKKLPKQKSFILPLGKPGAAHLHLAKAICRRAERKIVFLRSHLEFNLEIIRYINRLSDLLFIYARLENKGKDVPVKYD